MRVRVDSVADYRELRHKQFGFDLAKPPGQRANLTGCQQLALAKFGGLTGTMLDQSVNPLGKARLHLGQLARVLGLQRFDPRSAVR